MNKIFSVIYLKSNRQIKEHITPLLCVNYLHRCIIAVSKPRVTQNRNFTVWPSSVSFNLKRTLFLSYNIAYQQNFVDRAKALLVSYSNS